MPVVIWPLGMKVEYVKDKYSPAKLIILTASRKFCKQSII